MNMQQNPNYGMMPHEMQMNPEMGMYPSQLGVPNGQIPMQSDMFGMGNMGAVMAPDLSYAVNPDGSPVKRPTGGIIAYSMKQNPYLSPSGNFRKPRHDEIIKELQIFKGLTVTGRAVRVSDINVRIRHCCVTRPYFHVLSAEKYRVVLPNNEIEVIYYIHRECDTLIVVGDTLSE